LKRRLALGRLSPPREDLPSVDGIVRTIMRGGHEILGTEDPLDVELWASYVLGFSYKRLPWGVEEDFTQMVFNGAFASAERVGDAGSLAVLRALGSVAPEPYASACAAVRDRLSATGRPEPGWAAELGAPVFERAWTLADRYGAQIAYYTHFQNRGRDEHLVGAVYDENHGGIIKDATIGVLADDPRARAGADPECVVADIDAGELSARVLAAIERGDTFIDNDWTDDFRELRALLISRMRSLPPADLPEPEVLGDAPRETIIEAFLATPGAPTDDPTTRGILDHCFTARCDFGDGDPFRWSPTVVEVFMLDFLPRKASLDAGQIRALPSVLRSWVRYALTRRGLDEDHIEATMDVVGRLESEFRREATNPDNFGPAKAVTNAMLADRVDLLDEEAVEAWLDGFNARTLEERADFLAGRLGFDPPPASRRPRP